MKIEYNWDIILGYVVQISIYPNKKASEQLVKYCGKSKF